MLPPPPTPTLFPYTTLFRSVPIPEVARFRKHHLPGHGRDPVRLVQRIQRRNLLEAGHQAFGRVDRKSTRLNSSHPSISYAVFCLKKKKKTKHIKLIT